MCSKVLGRTRLLVFFIVAIAAANVRASFLPSGVDFWFTTSTPSIFINARHGVQLVMPGSIMSTDGSVIATSQDLLGKFKPLFGSIPILNKNGVGALAVTGSSRRKSIVFSVQRPFYSTALQRTIGDGDLLNNQGQIVATQQDLLSAYSPRNASVDYGLNTAYINSDTANNGGPEIWFSTKRDFYSNTLGRTVTSNDILSNTGDVIATLDNLIKAFQPRGNVASLGLDTFYVTLTSQGKVSDYLFSTQKSFYSQALHRNIDANDLLDSNGNVVMTTNDMIQSFGWRIPAICCCTMDLDLHGAAFSIPNSNKTQDSSRRTIPKAPEPATLALDCAGTAGNCTAQAVILRSAGTHPPMRPGPVGLIACIDSFAQRHPPSQDPLALNQNPRWTVHHARPTGIL